MTLKGTIGFVFRFAQLLAVAFLVTYAAAYGYYKMNPDSVFKYYGVTVLNGDVVPVNSYPMVRSKFAIFQGKVTAYYDDYAECTDPKIGEIRRYEPIKSSGTHYKKPLFSGFDEIEPAPEGLDEQYRRKSKRGWPFRWDPFHKPNVGDICRIVGVPNISPLIGVTLYDTVYTDVFEIGPPSMPEG